MLCRFLVVTTLFATLVQSQECTLDCPVGETCYTDAATALDCLYSIPMNEEWADQTIDVLSSSLENFGFGALYHSTGPPYVINLDIQGELSVTRTMVADKTFATDIEFQEHLQALFQSTLDAHTRYQKPVCYNAIFVQPFAFDIRIDEDPTNIVNEPKLFLMSNLYTEEYKAMFPAVDVDALLEQQVTLVNGVEFTTEISSWGDSHETRSNNRGARFNAALRSYLYRSAISTQILPVQDLTVTLTADLDNPITLPWMVSYTNGLANVSYCAAVPPEEEELTAVEEVKNIESSSSSSPLSLSMKSAGKAYRVGNTFRKQLIHEDETNPMMPLQQEVLHANRADRTVILPTSSPNQISCFIQHMNTNGEDEEAVTAGVSNVLVMKVASFSPAGEYYIDAWEAFLGDVQTCLSTEFTYELMIVDVMQNGGGYVCLGLRLLELLIQEYNEDTTKVQMNYDLPHSSLMDTYIKAVNDPNPYPFAADVEQILNQDTQQSFVDGEAYYYPGRNVTMGGVKSWRTNYFSLDCREAEALPADGFIPSTFLPPERLIILTDGTCGSTCASFTKIPQEAGLATFVGAGGIWDEGMDVSSFAGGFVCNPDYLEVLTDLSNDAMDDYNYTFPKFYTNQRWQFGWAAWYSAKQPSRPTQFTVQQPDYREAFWGFPHASINASVTTDMVSTLYDRVIDSTITRLALATDATTNSGGDNNSNKCDNKLSKNQEHYLELICLALAAILLIIGGYYTYYKCSGAEMSEKQRRKSQDRANYRSAPGTGASGADDMEESFIKNTLNTE